MNELEKKYEEIYGKGSSQIPTIIKIGVDIKLLFSNCLKNKTTWQQELKIKERSY